MKSNFRSFLKHLRNILSFNIKIDSKGQIAFSQTFQLKFLSDIEVSFKTINQYSILSFKVKMSGEQ